MHSASSECIRLIQHSTIRMKKKYVVIVTADHKDPPFERLRKIVTIHECKHCAEWAVYDVFLFQGRW